MELEFEVSGSQGDVYRIRVGANHGAPWISCTCQAGQNGTACKHRLALLQGDAGAVVSSNAAQVGRIAAAFAGSDVLHRLAAVGAAEAKADAAKRELAKAKQALGLAMVGGRR